MTHKCRRWCFLGGWPGQLVVPAAKPQEADGPSVASLLVAARPGQQVVPATQKQVHQKSRLGTYGSCIDYRDGDITRPGAPGGPPRSRPVLGRSIPRPVPATM